MASTTSLLYNDTTNPTTTTTTISIGSIIGYSRYLAMLENDDANANSLNRSTISNTCNATLMKTDDQNKNKETPSFGYGESLEKKAKTSSSKKRKKKKSRDFLSKSCSDLDVLLKEGEGGEEKSLSKSKRNKSKKTLNYDDQNDGKKKKSYKKINEKCSSFSKHNNINNNINIINNNKSKRKRKQLLSSHRSKSCSRLSITNSDLLLQHRDQNYWLLKESEEKDKCHIKTKKRKGIRRSSSSSSSSKKKNDAEKKIKRKLRSKKKDFMSKSCSNLNVDFENPTAKEEEDLSLNEGDNKTLASSGPNRRRLLKKSQSVCSRNERKSKVSSRSSKSNKESKRCKKKEKGKNCDSYLLSKSCSNLGEFSKSCSSLDYNSDLIVIDEDEEDDDDEDSITACIRLYLAIHQEEEEEDQEAEGDLQQQEPQEQATAEDLQIKTERIDHSFSFNSLDKYEDDDDSSIDMNVLLFGTAESKLLKTTEKNLVNLSKERNDEKGPALQKESDSKSPRYKNPFDRTLFLSPCLDATEVSARPIRLRGLSPGMETALGKSCPNLSLEEGKEAPMASTTSCSQSMIFQGMSSDSNMSLGKCYPSFLLNLDDDDDDGGGGGGGGDSDKQIAYGSERSTRFRGLSPMTGQKVTKGRVAHLRLAFQKDKSQDTGRSCPNLMRENSVSKLRLKFEK